MSLDRQKQWVRTWPFPERLKQDLLLFLRRRGFELSKLNEAPQFVTLIELVRSLGLTAVVDVGANEGQFGRGIRSAGFDGLIVSLEPLSGPYRRLAEEASIDPLWTVVNAALAGESGEREMTVASNLGMSSSFLEMSDLHKMYAPNSVGAGTEIVQTEGWLDLLRRLPDGDVLLKLDVQGFEGEVLRDPHAVAMLHRAGVVIIEVSCTKLYEGAWTPGDCISFMESRGFEIFSLFPEWFDKHSLRLLQFNVVFVRRGESAPKGSNEQE